MQGLSIFFALVLNLSAASGFVLASGRAPSLVVRRSYAPVAIADLSGALSITQLVAEAGEAPPMADGSIAIAIGGGILAILTAGIPILFLGKDDAPTASEKMADLEKGIGSMAEMAEIDGMEVIDEADMPPPSPPTGDAKTGSI